MYCLFRVLGPPLAVYKSRPHISNINLSLLPISKLGVLLCAVLRIATAAVPPAPSLNVAPS
jgi:hypothetical protein